MRSALLLSPWPADIDPDFARRAGKEIRPEGLIAMEVERVNVLGVGVSVLDQDGAREFLFECVRTGQRGYVTVTGVHGVSEAQDDAALREIFSRALLVTPDGMPMVWMGKLQGRESIQRVYGPDLMLN